MQFNDPTNKSGIIQDIEFWTNLGDGVISGDPVSLKEFTRLVNLRYAKVMGKLQILSGTDGAEDTNYASQQFSTFAIVNGQNDYQFLTDGDGNTISDITGVQIIPSGGSDFKQLDRLSLSDRRAELVMSPNSSMAGTPTAFIEKNNTIFFDRIPDYGLANGGKLFYRLVPSYFASSDTSKEPGFAPNFHRQLSLGASYDWLCVNKSDNQVLISRVQAELTENQSDLDTYVRQKNPTSTRMTAHVESSH